MINDTAFERAESGYYKDFDPYADESLEQQSCSVCGSEFIHEDDETICPDCQDENQQQQSRDIRH